MKTNDIVEKCRTQFSNSLYGGNCGMFALALGTFLQRHGISSNIVIFSDYCEDEHGAPRTAFDIMNCEPDVYHVALQVDGLLYDGDGQVTEQHILNWIAEEYDDKSPTVSTFPLQSKGVRQLMDNDTDWDTHPGVFLDFIEKVTH